MATLLYRLGRAAFARRWLVTSLWVLILGIAGVGAAIAPAASEDTSFMPGIEAQKASDLIGERFPGGSTDGAYAQVVFIAPDGSKMSAADERATVEAFVSEAADGPHVSSVTDPFQAGAVSEDGSTAYATVNFAVSSSDLTDDDKAALEKSVDEARDTGLTVEVGGDALAAAISPGGTAEVVGLALAAVVLLVTFGSLAAAGLPLLTAVIGIGISMAGIVALSSTLGLSMTSTSLASMLGLAVGIDYALFVVSRYREERAAGHPAREAAGLAVGTAGSAVVFAGLTVVIALAGLSVVGVPMLTKMGLVAAAAVLVAVLIALTLVPALLGMWPDAVLSRRTRKRGGAAGHASGAEENGGSRWARFVLRRPVPVLLACIAGLGIVALPAAHLEMGMPGAESQPTSSTERRAYDALADGFGAGFNGPLTVVADLKGADDPDAAAEAIARTVGDTDGVVSVSTPQLNDDRDAALFSAVPTTGPNDEKTKDLVQTIRAERPELQTTTGATFQVTGSTAMNIDVAQALQKALVPYLAVVVGLALLLLLVVFRSLLVPLKAAAGFLLSVLASLGVVVAVFQWGWGAGVLGVEQPGPIMSLMPIFLVGIVFGLAMDYEVFLVARMREAYIHGDRAPQAVVSGFRHSARVVVAAAVIMIAVFAGFVGADESMIKTMGFGLAVAVLLDAFVIRMAFVPAVLALLGDRAWRIPRRLDKVLPHVDVEGSGLTGPAVAADDPAPREATRVL
ncbi:MMPL family transporter [Streptomyces sp. NPDC057376]|uniref:MMPL family transporter n=1 Tax=unclassified Streptomyces TaxID=2593676 RepID=UPI00093E1888|nr:MMPL family transporter [Streptomyces sp. CB02414]OKI86092.1 hypothetical protein AMK11_14745 [Streptomyces sp. CB02414]